MHLFIYRSEQLGAMQCVKCVNSCLFSGLRSLGDISNKQMCLLMLEGHYQPHYCQRLVLQVFFTKDTPMANRGPKGLSVNVDCFSQY